MNIINIPLPDYERLEVYPVADVHLGDPKTDEGLFKSFLKQINEQPNRYVIIAGDMINNALKSSVSNVYNEKYSPKEQKYMMAEYLEPIKDRILCMINGNHEERSLKDSDNDITEDIAHILGIQNRFADNGAYINIQFGKDRHGHRMSYTGYAVHGIGGGKRAGAPANILEMLPLTFIADFYIIGHLHRRIGFKNTYFKPNAIYSELEECERAYVCCAPWQSYGGYAQRKLYVPSGRGIKPLILNGRHKSMEIVI